MLAVHKLIDFTKADVLSPDWWQHYRSRRDTLSRQLDLVGLQAHLQLCCAQVANSRFDPETTQARALDVVRDLIDWSKPWARKSEKQRRKTKTEQLKSGWEEAYGSMSDPITKASIAAAVAELDERLKAPADPEADQIKSFYENLDRQREAQRRRK